MSASPNSIDTTTHEPGNGVTDLEAKSALVPSSTIPDYEIMDPTSEIAVEWQGVLTKHKFRQAEKKELINLSQAFIRSTEMLGGGRERWKFSDDEAFSTHYMVINEGAWVLPDHHLVSDFDNAQWIQLTPDEIAEFTFELRAQVIRNLYRSEAVLERQTKGYDHLFDRKGLWIVKHAIGHPLNPQFEIRFKMARPGGERRLRYRENANRIETQREPNSKKSRRDIIIDLEEGMRLFREYFRGIESGAVIEGKPFDENGFVGEGDNRLAHRDVVLQNFNGFWQAEVADALVSAYQSDSSD